ncbi:MAG: hypothetical protein MJZ99_02885 [Bacteroidales bacterium]|nr:hypothetical protein [Bacteroidales bacterium]
MMFTYTINADGTGVIHYQIPDDIAQYPGVTFSEYNTFDYHSDEQTISLHIDGSTYIYHKQ